MDLRGPITEDIEFKCEMRPCALPDTREREHMEIEKVESCV